MAAENVAVTEKGLVHFDAFEPLAQAHSSCF